MPAAMCSLLHVMSHLIFTPTRNRSLFLITKLIVLSELITVTNSCIWSALFPGSWPPSDSAACPLPALCSWWVPTVETTPPFTVLAAKSWRPPPPRLQVRALTAWIGVLFRQTSGSCLYLFVPQLLSWKKKKGGLIIVIAWQDWQEDLIYTFPYALCYTLHATFMHHAQELHICG